MTPGRRWRKPSRRFWRWVSVAIPIGVVVFLLVGFWNWIPVTYSDYVVAPGAGCAPYACFVRVASTSFPSGENLTVHWVDDSGGSVGFLVLGLHWSALGLLLNGSVPQCSETGSSGGCMFTSVAGNYTFEASGTTANEGRQTVNFTTTYLGSLL